MEKALSEFLHKVRDYYEGKDMNPEDTEILWHVTYQFITSQGIHEFEENLREKISQLDNEQSGFDESQGAIYLMKENPIGEEPALESVGPYLFRRWGKWYCSY